MHIISVPLGETNEEFYQGIYTGQQYVPPTSSNNPPPLPSEPPAWERIYDRDEPQDCDGPAWVCHRCTFDNHPLMNKCEQCDMPKVNQNNQGMQAPNRFGDFGPSTSGLFRVNRN